MTSRRSDTLRFLALFGAALWVGCFANPTPHPSTGEDEFLAGGETSTGGPPNGVADTSNGASDMEGVADAAAHDVGPYMPDASSEDDASPEPADGGSADDASSRSDGGEGGDGGAGSDADLTDGPPAGDVAKADGGGGWSDVDQDLGSDATGFDDVVTGDSGTSDVGSDAPAPGCDATYPTPVILRCGAQYEVFSYWADLANADCPSWFSPNGPDPVVYETVDALANAEGCDANCLYDATKSVDFLTCDGPKSGYDVYEAGDKNCTGPLHYTPDGIFEDLCQWEAYACYCMP